MIGCHSKSLVPEGPTVV